jgi:hypothetical protein
MKKTLFSVLLSVLASSSFAQNDRLAITNLRATQDYGSAKVSGTAKNQSDKPIKNAFIHFNLYDGQGTLIGNTIAHAENIDPHGSWNFSASTPVTFATVRVADVKLFD